MQWSGMVEVVVVIADGAICGSGKYGCCNCGFEGFVEDTDRQQDRKKKLLDVGEEVD